jgi:hypothetical protein
MVMRRSDLVWVSAIGGGILAILAGIIAFVVFVPVVSCPNVPCIYYREVASEGIPGCPICQGADRITLLKRYALRQDLSLPVWK